MKYEVKEKLNSFGEKHRIFQPNDIVRHFKGNLYRIITIARNTETKELEIIYESHIDAFTTVDCRYICYQSRKHLLGKG